MLGEHTEQWKPVVGFEGHYEVSNCGRVRSLTRKIRHGSSLREAAGRLLSLNWTIHGYPCLNLCKNRRKKFFRVHQIVALAFLPPQPTPKHEVNHLNGDKADNRDVNLEWMTRAENNRHAFRIGLRSNAGECHSQVKLSARQVIGIRQLLRWGANQTWLARLCQVDPSTVHCIASSKNWSTALLAQPEPEEKR